MCWSMNKLQGLHTSCRILSQPPVPDNRGHRKVDVLEVLLAIHLKQITTLGCDRTSPKDVSRNFHGLPSFQDFQPLIPRTIWTQFSDRSYSDDVVILARDQVDSLLDRLRTPHKEYLRIGRSIRQWSWPLPMSSRIVHTHVRSNRTNRLVGSTFCTIRKANYRLHPRNKYHRILKWIGCSGNTQEEQPHRLRQLQMYWPSPNCDKNTHHKSRSLPYCEMGIPD